ncbi:restriction endonuclease subunit S [Lactobacillus sp. M0396]|uniref:restriction endonuclease subunit S n=1 Tax=Lactobacillus sp. M0396 TaxID=2751030 RepID=UPI0018DD66C8|nr:restriction endonuclease subunit S [Lactobacillus sp. M0396]MBI0033440.1 restriction endonuclease subunit S [Lactobacillus sp. M0396]
MSNKNRVPNIRFMGFKGEWAEKKFINCLAKIIDFRGKTPKKLGLSWSNNGKYRALSALNVKNGFIDKNIDVHFGNYDLYKKWMGNTELEKGDILFTTEAPMGNIAIIKDDEKYILSQRTIAFRVDEKNINGSFLLYKLNTVSTKNKLMSLSTGGTAQGISQKNLSYLFISVSNDLNEQQKIGDFFSKLDKLLDLQQQKIDKLELLKKALLQKLFPRHDAKIPELRFKGFEGDWNEKRLNSITKRLDNYRKPITANKRLSGQTPYYGANGIQDYVKGYTHEGEFVLIAEDGANDVRNYPVRFVKGYIWVNNHAHVLQAKVGTSNNLFLAYSLKNRNLLPYLVGSGRMKLNADVLMNLLLKIPDLNEQQKIGNLLSKVDQLIELENKKLQNFQQVKKCLLQNMFVE